MKISVALAAYKGEQYISGQIDSILSQLGENDELIVSDDFPSGKTREIVLGYQANDKRLRYIEGDGKGVVRNFENALKACSGDVIFLSDQDDIWMSDKVKLVMKEISDGADLVLHDAAVTDSDLNITEPSYFAVHGSNASFFGNMARNSFVGCCMAFRKEVLHECLPFPEALPMHDWWIALVAMKKKKKVVLLPEPLIKWRRHSGTVTGRKTSLLKKITWRFNILLSLMKIK